MHHAPCASCQQQVSGRVQPWPPSCTRQSTAYSGTHLVPLPAKAAPRHSLPQLPVLLPPLPPPLPLQRQRQGIMVRVLRRDYGCTFHDRCTKQAFRNTSTTQHSGAPCPPAPRRCGVGRGEPPAAAGSAPRRRAAGTGWTAVAPSHAAPSTLGQGLQQQHQQEMGTAAAARCASFWRCPDEPTAQMVQLACPYCLQPAGKSPNFDRQAVACVAVATMALPIKPSPSLPINNSPPAIRTKWALSWPAGSEDNGPTRLVALPETPPNASHELVPNQ